MATAETKSQYRRAAEFAPGIGKNLDELLNKDVLLVAYSIGERPLNRRQDNGEEGESRGAEQATIVYLTIAVDIDKFNPEDVQGTSTLYHAWSDSLAEKIAAVPTEQLPMLIKFSRVQTSGGFKVLTFE